MSHLRVVAPGFLTTVQDLGRFGHGEEGISAAGAADPLALRLGNGLLGNPEGAPALEMTLIGGTFLFERAATAVYTSGRHEVAMRKDDFREALELVDAIVEARAA